MSTQFIILKRNMDWLTYDIWTDRHMDVEPEMIIPSPIHLVFANNIKYHNESTVLQQSIMNY